MVLLCLSGVHSVCAKDLGVYGQTFAISEPDLLKHILTKLRGMQQDGSLLEHQQSIAQKVRRGIERPASVKGISRARKDRVFTFDPSITISQDLSDHQGRVFHKAGTKINPLDEVSLSSELVFFDSDDEEQKQWVHQRLQKTELPKKLILVNGAPLELSKEWQTPVYFDQRGVLTAKLGIKQVPAVVKQRGKVLQITEVEIGS